MHAHSVAWHAMDPVQDARSNVQLIWDTKVTVRVVLDASDVSSMDPPPLLYFQVARHSYLHTLLPEALRMLHHLLPPGEHTPWLEYNRLPLKWNVPAGVMYDLLVPRHDAEPWPLVLHVRRYPSAMLTAYSGEASLRDSLLNSLKEAAFICSGSANRVLGMSEGSRQELLRAVQERDATRHSEVLHSLQLHKAGPSNDHAGPAIPVRVHIRSDGGSFLSSYESITYTSRPVAARHASGAAVSLRDALTPLLPSAPAARAGSAQASNAGAEEATGAEATVSNGGSSSSSGGGGGNDQQPQPSSGGGDSGVPGASASAGNSERTGGWRVVVYVGGVLPSLDSPLEALHSDLHGPDYFLHVVAHCAL